MFPLFTVFLSLPYTLLSICWPNDTAAMNTLSCMPPEIVVRILQSCSDFCQLLALASTCKHIYSVWTQNSQAIITKALIATLNVQSFDDALLAVRSTLAVTLFAILTILRLKQPISFAKLCYPSRKSRAPFHYWNC